MARFTRTSLNYQALLEASVLVAMAGALLYLLRTELYLRYLSAAARPWLYFAAAILCLLAAEAARRWRQANYRSSYRHCLFLLVPLLLLCLPQKDLQGSDYASGKLLVPAAFEQAQPSAVAPKPTDEPKLSLQTEAAGEFNSEYSYSQPAPASQQTGQNTAGATAEIAGTPAGEIPADGQVYINTSNMYPWLSLLYKDPKPYRDLHFHLSGFVYAPALEGGYSEKRNYGSNKGETAGLLVASLERKQTTDGDATEPESSQNTKEKQTAAAECAIARLAMVCCAADMTPAGFWAVNETGQELQVDAWYEVSGVLAYKLKGDRLQAVLHLYEAKPTTPPEPAFILPLLSPLKD